MNFFKRLKFAIPISLMLWLMLFFTINCFSAPVEVITEKADDTHINLTVTKIDEITGEKNTTIKEKTFTVNEIIALKAAHTTSQQSWIDSKAAADENIVIQQEEIDTYDSILEECVTLGVVEELIEIDKEP